MSDIGEAVGTAVEGGLYAKAIDSNAKGGGKDGAEGAMPLQKGHFAEEACLNCNAQLIGSHCHQCGQKAHLHRTIRAFMHDLLHGALHFDGKLWRTLPMLVFKPGKLTRRYIEGERARFVSPMAIFLFSVFLMFAVFQVLGLSTPTNIQNQIDVLERGHNEGRGEELGALDANSAREEPAGERPAIQESPGAVGDDNPARRDAEEEPAVTEGSGQTAEPTVAADGEASFNTGIAWLDNKLLAKWNENPSLMLYKLQANAYKFSWLLIPISIPFVWLLFAWKRRFKAYDHAIFVTYSLSFVTLLFITISSLAMIGFSQAALLLLLIPPIHLYKQLRHTYALSRFSAFWRLIVLSLFIWIVIILFLQVLFLLGAF